MKKFDSGNTLREAILIFFMVFIGYGYFSSEADANINSRLALVKAFVEEGRLEIDSYHETELYTIDKAFFNGHYYSDKAIGTSLLGVIVYYPIRSIYARADVRLPPRLFRELLTFFVVSLPTSLIAPFIFVLIKNVTANTIRSLIITLAISLGTPLYKYSTAFYGHALAAECYFLAFLIWFYLRRKHSLTLPSVFILSFLLGFMVITEYPTAFLVICLSLYIALTLYQSKHLFDWKSCAMTITGFAIPICIQLYYNNSIFGSPFTFGYTHETNELFKEAHTTSLMGIGWPDLRVFFYQTLHPSLGLFWESPILLLSIIGFFFLLQREEYRAEAYFILGTIILYILLISGYYMWWGGVAFTPRHLIPILPLFALPLAFIPRKFSVLLLILAAISIFQNLIMTSCGYKGLKEFLNHLLDGKLIPVYQGTTIYKICLPNIISGHLMNNRGLQLLGLNGLWSILPLLFLVIAILLVFFRFLHFTHTSK